MIGTVTSFNSKNGWGFISAEDGQDYFVHYKDILMEKYKYLNPGNKVEFEVGVNEKNSKAKAVNVKKIG